MLNGTTHEALSNDISLQESSVILEERRRKYDEELWKRLETAFEKEKIYADPEISLESLCKHVLSNKVYVNRVLKEKTGLTYSEYLKKKRISVILNELDNNKNVSEKTLNDILFYAGYRSYVTALRHFKEIVGCTPTEYLQSQSDK